MRVTFDTNALSDVIAPQTSQRGALGTASGKKVRAAIEADHARLLLRNPHHIRGHQKRRSERSFWEYDGRHHLSARDGSRWKWCDLHQYEGGADGPQTARPAAGRSISGRFRSWYVIARRSESRNGPCRGS